MAKQEGLEPSTADRPRLLSGEVTYLLVYCSVSKTAFNCGAFETMQLKQILFWRIEEVSSPTAFLLPAAFRAVFRAV